MTDAKTDPTKPTKSARQHLISIATFVGILAAAYFINVEVQSYLGRKAAEATGLPERTVAEAIAEAKQEGKLVLVDVSAVWCPSCRKLDNNVLAREDVKAAIDERYAFTRVDYDTAEGQRVAAKYQIRGVPTLMVLDTQGELVRYLSAVHDPKRFIAQL